MISHVHALISKGSIADHYNYRMAQPTEWVPAILDYMKKMKLNISTMVFALISNYDS